MQEVIKTFASIFFLYCSKNFPNKKKKNHFWPCLHSQDTGKLLSV